jgi:hypothetical protein
VCARDSYGQIQYSTWLSLTGWQPVPGTIGTASDPLVISRRSSNTALFCRDASGGGVWRGSPLPLTPYRVFLPMVSKAGSGTVSVPSGGGASATAGLAASTWEGDCPRFIYLSLINK